MEYESNGQVRIVEDKVIVKYDGFGLSTGSGGKYIKWKQTLASGNDEVVLFEDGESEWIIFTVRERNFHLEDELHSEETKVPNLIKEVRDERGGTTSSLYYETKIKLINFEYGEPLKE